MYIYFFISDILLFRIQPEKSLFSANSWPLIY